MGRSLIPFKTCARIQGNQDELKTLAKLQVNQNRVNVSDIKFFPFDSTS